MTDLQLSLDLAGKPAMTRDDFVVSASNRAASDLVGSWPAWPSSLVILAGPTGSGKTHLASAWVQEAGARIVDASAVLPQDIDAVSGSPAVLDAVSEKVIDEEGMFHLINAARAAGQNLLMTARTFPSVWPVRLPDLASRLKAATIVEIGEPDDALLEAVIVKLFSDRQLSVDHNVARYVAARIERSLATAIDVVGRLDTLALSRRQRVTRQLAAEVIRASDMGQSGLPFED